MPSVIDRLEIGNLCISGTAEEINKLLRLHREAAALLRQAGEALGPMLMFQMAMDNPCSPEPPEVVASVTSRDEGSTFTTRLSPEHLREAARVARLIGGNMERHDGSRDEE